MSEKELQPFYVEDISIETINQGIFPMGNDLYVSNSLPPDLKNPRGITNADASYITAGRLYDAVVDLKGGGDFLTIQAAINVGKTKIFVRAGTYIITADISLPNGCELVGEDAKTTIITANNAAYQVKAIGASGSEFTGLHIANLTFSGSTDTDGMLYFNYVDESIIENCIFTTDNTIVGFSQYNSDFNIITQNFSYANFIIAGNYTKIISNIFIETSDTAIGCIGENIFIENNIIYDCETGIVAYFKPTISNNYICNSVGNAITVYTGPIKISNNRIINSGGYAIYSTAGINNITGNYISWCANIGIYVYSKYLNQNIISENNINTETDNIDGIKLMGNTSNGNESIILGNYVITYGTGNSIMLDAMNSCVISSNVITNGGSGKGIKINDSGCNNNIIIGNIATNGIEDNGTGTEVAHNISL